MSGANSHVVIFLNFMPSKLRRYAGYLLAWIAYSILFEAVCVRVHFVNYSTWKLGYSAIVYLLIYLFLRWHIRFLRKAN